MTPDVRRAVIVVVTLLTLTNIGSVAAIFYVKTLAVKNAVDTKALPQAQPGPAAGPGPGYAPGPASGPGPAFAPGGAGPTAPASDPMLPPAGGEAGGGTSVTVYQLPVGDVFRGLVEMQRDPKQRMDAAQATAAQAVLLRMRDHVAVEDGTTSNLIAALTTILTPAQAKAMRGRRAEMSLATPGADGRSPLQKSAIELLEARAKGQPTAAATPVAGDGYAIPAEEVFSGILALDSDDRLRVTPQQAARLLPYATAQVEAAALGARNKRELLAILRPAQHEFLLAVRGAAPAGPIGPEEVMKALRGS